MKIQTNKKPIAIIIVSILVAGIIGGSAYAIVKTVSNDNATNQSEQTTAPDKEVVEPPQGATSNSGVKNEDGTTVNDATNTAPHTDVSVVIVDASQYDDTFEIRAYANAVESGTCTYTFSKGAVTFQKEAVASTSATTSSCATFNVPTTDFPETGEWNLTVTYTSASDKYSGSATQTVTIK